MKKLSSKQQGVIRDLVKGLKRLSADEYTAQVKEIINLITSDDDYVYRADLYECLARNIKKFKSDLLHTLVSCGQTNIAEAIINAGDAALISITDQNGDHVLHIAAQNNNLRIARAIYRRDIAGVQENYQFPCETEVQSTDNRKPSDFATSNQMQQFLSYYAEEYQQEVARVLYEKETLDAEKENAVDELSADLAKTSFSDRVVQNIGSSIRTGGTYVSQFTNNLNLVTNRSSNLVAESKQGTVYETPLPADYQTDDLDTYWARKNIACYNTSLNLAAVGQIQWKDLSGETHFRQNVSGKRWGSGFLIDETTFVTAGHCFDKCTGQGWWFLNGDTNQPIASNELIKYMTVNFNFANSSCTTEEKGNDAEKYEVKYEIDSLLEHRQGGLDYAIVKLKPSPFKKGLLASNSTLKDYGVLKLTTAIPSVDSTLHIPQHPDGRPKKLTEGPLQSLDEDDKGYTLVLSSKIPTIVPNKTIVLMQDEKNQINAYYNQGNRLATKRLNQKELKYTLPFQNAQRSDVSMPRRGNEKLVDGIASQCGYIPKSIGYKVSTNGGSSGAPVLDNEQNVIAIHASGFLETTPRQENSGVPIAAVAEVSPIIRKTLGLPASSSTVQSAHTQTTNSSTSTVIPTSSSVATTTTSSKVNTNLVNSVPRMVPTASTARSSESVSKNWQYQTNQHSIAQSLTRQNGTLASGGLRPREMATAKQSLQNILPQAQTNTSLRKTLRR